MDGQVTVTLHSPFRDIAGCRQITLTVTDPVSVADALRLLADRCPGLRPYLTQGGQQGGAFLLVVNGRLTRPEDAVRPGDEIFLCAQVSGG